MIKLISIYKWPLSLSLLCILSFQNCSQTPVSFSGDSQSSSEKTKNGDSLVLIETPRANGNGVGYDGKLTFYVENNQQYCDSLGEQTPLKEIVEVDYLAKTARRIQSECQVANQSIAYQEIEFSPSRQQITYSGSTLYLANQEEERLSLLARDEANSQNKSDPEMTPEPAPTTPSVEDVVYREPVSELPAPQLPQESSGIRHISVPLESSEGCAQSPTYAFATGQFQTGSFSPCGTVSDSQFSY